MQRINDHTVICGRPWWVWRAFDGAMKYDFKDSGELRCLDLAEDMDLPADMTVGKLSYRHFKSSDISSANKGK